MDSFVISQLEAYSGIKAHTIRIWEQRYNALTPNRSEGNTRYYNSSQLRRLLNIVSLMNEGHKISELATLDDTEIFDILNDQLISKANQYNPNEFYISQLIGAGLAYDEPYFEKILSNCILRLGFGKTYTEIIYPLLVRLGLMWAGNLMPAVQEHFMSNLLRQKLFTAIDALPPYDSVDNTWVLFLPENEFHEIGLLYAHYLIKKAGKRVIYLGSNVPKETLTTAIDEIAPLNLLFFFVHNDIPENAQEFLNDLSHSFPLLQVYMSGNEKLLSKLKLRKNTTWLNSPGDLENLLG